MTRPFPFRCLQPDIHAATQGASSQLRQMTGTYAPPCLRSFIPTIFLTPLPAPVFALRQASMHFPHPSHTPGPKLTFAPLRDIYFSDSRYAARSRNIFSVSLSNFGMFSG